MAELPRIIFKRIQQQIRNSLSSIERPQIHPFDLSAVRDVLQPPQGHATDHNIFGLRQPNTRTVNKILFGEFSAVFANHNRGGGVILLHNAVCQLDLCVRRSIYLKIHFRSSCLSQVSPIC